MRLLIALIWLLALPVISGCNPDAAIEAEVKQNLKDPDSAQFRNIKRFPDDVVCGEVNSRNSFGGYAGYQPFAHVDGKVSFGAAEIATWCNDVVGKKLAVALDRLKESMADCKPTSPISASCDVVNQQRLEVAEIRSKTSGVPAELMASAKAAEADAAKAVEAFGKVYPEQRLRNLLPEIGKTTDLCDKSSGELRVSSCELSGIYAEEVDRILRDHRGPTIPADLVQKARDAASAASAASSRR